MMNSIWAFALAFWMFWFPQTVVRVPGPGGAVPSGGGVTPAFVQANGTSNGSLAGTTGLAFSTNVASGNALFIFFFDGNASGDTIAFSDSQGNTITNKGSVNVATDGDTMAIGCGIAGSSGADTIKWTINASGAASPVDLIIWEVSGATCTLDTTTSPSGGYTTSNTTFTTPVTSGSITTTTNGDLMLMYAANVHDRTSPDLQMSAGSGFSSLTCIVYNAAGLNCSPAGTDGVQGGVEMKVLTTAGADSGSITVTNPGASMEYGVIYATFKHS